MAFDVGAYDMYIFLDYLHGTQKRKWYYSSGEMLFLRNVFLVKYGLVT